jgi:hypothetical protein
VLIEGPHAVYIGQGAVQCAVQMSAAHVQSALSCFTLSAQDTAALVFTHWISHIGLPDQIVTDCGGHFNSVLTADCFPTWVLSNPSLLLIIRKQVVRQSVLTVSLMMLYATMCLLPKPTGTLTFPLVQIAIYNGVHDLANTLFSVWFLGNTLLLLLLCLVFVTLTIFLPLLPLLLLLGKMLCFMLYVASMLPAIAWLLAITPTVHIPLTLLLLLC